MTLRDEASTPQMPSEKSTVTSKIFLVPVYAVVGATAAILCISAVFTAICIWRAHLSKRRNRERSALSTEANRVYDEIVGPVYETLNGPGTEESVCDKKVSVFNNEAYKTSELNLETKITSLDEHFSSNESNTMQFGSTVLSMENNVSYQKLTQQNSQVATRSEEFTSTQLQCCGKYLEPFSESHHQLLLLRSNDTIYSKPSQNLDFQPYSSVQEHVL